MLKHRFTLKLIFLMLILSGCMPLYQKSSEQDFYNVFSEISLMDEKTFKRELLTTGKKPSSIDRTSSILYLKGGILLSHYSNPEPDYVKALEEFETYLHLEPDAGNDHLLLGWINFIMEINRLKKETGKLRSEVERLKKENKELKNKIDQIKSLDIQVEEKRKKTR